MKRVVSIIILSILVSWKVLSVNDTCYKKQIGINLMPLSMIDYTPRLRFGATLYFKDKLGIGLDCGIGNYSINKKRVDDMAWDQNYSLFELRPEFKYQLYNYLNKVYFYCAAEPFYIKMSSTLYNGYYYRVDNNTITFDEALLTKKKIGINAKIGFRAVAAHRIEIDLYTGIGVAQRSFMYSDVLNPQIGESHEMFEEWFSQKWKYEGEKVIPQLSLGFKFGFYLLNKTNT